MPLTSDYDYVYPNVKSYQWLPSIGTAGHWGYEGRALRHGYIFGYKQTAANVNWWAPEGRNPADYRSIDFENRKVFQFNPGDLPIEVQMMLTDSADVEAEGGLLPHVSVGLASTGLRLFFDRTQEIAMANKGKADPKWRDLGVQCDLFDLLKVISGGLKSRLGEYQGEDIEVGGLGASIKPGSLNHLTGTMLDAVVTGSQNISSGAFAVVFNPNLAYHVQYMSGLKFSYIRFTRDLVPTTVQIDMGLVISNMGTMSHVTSGGIAGANTSISGDSTSAGAPPSVFNPGTLADRLTRW